MNAGISRCWRNRRSITTPSARAAAIASSTSPPVPASRGVEDPGGAACWCRGRRGRGPRPSSTRLAPCRAPPAAPRSRRRPGRRVAGLAVGPGDDDGHGLAGERRPGRRPAPGGRGHHVLGDRPRARQAALLGVEVGAGEHRDDAGRGLGGRGVERGDPRVREGAAQDGQVQHARQRRCCRSTGAAGDQVLVLLAPARLADLEPRRRSSTAVTGRPPPPLAAACTAATMFW